MPYTVRATTVWGGTPPLSDEEQVAKIRKLYNGDFSDDEFDPAPVIAMRRDASSKGDLLARGSIISPSGKEIVTTLVWKSKAAWHTFSQHDTLKNYYDAMANHGWKVEITTV